MRFLPTICIYLILSSFTVNCWSKKEEKEFIKYIENFNEYKDTNDFLSSWSSRDKGYEKTLENNSYYYYIKEDPKNNKNKYLCSSLRMVPKDFIRTDIDSEKIKMVVDDSPVNSVTIYKSYWSRPIRIGKNYHKKEKEVFLEWDWIVNKLPEGSDENIKELNDSAIAIYAVLSFGMWRFKSIKFVWSATDKKGLVPLWSNEDDIRVYIVANKNDKLGVWKHESINLSKAIKDFVPEKYDSVSLIAISILSDTDTAKKKSSACIDNIKLRIK
jgi:hypothetical protein